jgi:hypothetical protein
MSTCSEASCDADVVTRGLCSRHYQRLQRVGLPDTLTRQCERCGTTFEVRARRGGARRLCASCPPLTPSDWRGQIRRAYGLAREDWDAMLVAQAGRCAICDEAMQNPCVDHCHATKRVRGLLCATCNSGLGYFKDSTVRLRNAASYLKESHA